MSAFDLPVHIDTPLFNEPRPLPVRWLYFANQVGVLPAAVALIQNHARWPDGALDVRWPSFGLFLDCEEDVLESLRLMQDHGMIRYRRDPDGRIWVRPLFKSLGRGIRWDTERWNDEPWRRSAGPG